MLHRGCAMLQLLQIAFRFKPCALHNSQLKLICSLNHTSEVALMLMGVACEPQLSWDVADGQLFFRPTCAGASSQRVVTVRNASRVPVGWKWVLSKKLQEAVSVQPAVSESVPPAVSCSQIPCRGSCCACSSCVLLEAAVDSVQRCIDDSNGDYAAGVQLMTS